jgi:beta-glucosidase
MQKIQNPEGSVKEDSEFLWGVANSAFQVEGSPVDSDWFRWTHEAGRISDKTNADTATDFWNRYDQDFKLAQELGCNAFRLSLAWERVEPRRGKWEPQALDAYEKMLLALRARGLEPVVTLNHFVLPAWLASEGGVLAPDFIPHFAEFARRTVDRLARGPARVKYWMTFNEPNVTALTGYMAGEWPPGVTGNFRLAVLAIARQARAHIEAVKKIRELGMDHVKVSFAHHWRLFHPASKSPADWGATKLVDYLFNRYFMDAVMTGNLAPGILRWKFPPVELPDKRPTLDYLGINYYGRTLISATMKSPYFKLIDGGGLKTDLNWEIYPEGLTTVMLELQRYGLPVLITENGLADAADKQRSRFLEDHLKALRIAREQGVDIFGYLHWSLTDNFEWAFGSWPKFGLVEIDYSTLARKPRPSYYVYKDLIARHRGEIS